MPRVIICRHGETALNTGGASAERIRGWKDIPLDNKGTVQAEELAKKLCVYDVREVYSSPLSRAFDTALAIGSKCQVSPIHKNASLLPWNLGALQGELVAGIIEAMKWYTIHEDNRVDGGEPFKAFRLRYLDFLKRKCEEVHAWPKDDIMVLVAHSRNMQCAKAWLAAGCPDDLTISTDAMNDYSDETGTGLMLVVKV